MRRMIMRPRKSRLLSKIVFGFHINKAIMVISTSYDTIIKTLSSTGFMNLYLMRK